MSQPSFSLAIADDIAVVTFDLPGSKANTLGQPVQSDLETLLVDLEKRTDLHGLILQSGKPGMFIAGADIKELGAPISDAEQVRRLVRRGLAIIGRFENLPFPTVALIDGSCLGGGTELALGFDYRLAGGNPRCEIGLPEVKLGLIPGWGGTQRLSRVIGPSLALEMITTGESAKAERAKEIGVVFDAVPSERLREEAVRLLAWSRQSGDWKEARKKKRQPVGLSEDQLRFTVDVARGLVLMKTKGQLPAPLAAIDAIEKGINLPLEDGLKAETDKFVPLVGSPISRNLIAVFFMNTKVAKDPGVADPKMQPRPVNKVAVLGAGIMGAGIAGAHVRRGVPAKLLDSVPAALEKGVAGIAKSLQGRVEIGRMTQAEMLKSVALVAPIGQLKDVADCDVVVEAVVENEAVKTEVYRALHDILPDSAILASNTSTISITRMAKAWKNPAHFAGMHFFNPVDRMQLVEVIRGAATSDETVVTLVALARRIGKTPIVVRDCPGFLVNRILFPYLNESLILLEEGADPRAIDKAALAFGMPMGPITLSDVVGLDTCLYAGRVVNAAFADRAQASGVLDELVKAGRLGQKSGAGFYSYAKGSKGVDDPALDKILAPFRKAPRPVGQEEITERLFLPMLTEASRVLTEGIVRDPVDVDMGLILGIGFPTFRGGLLHWADTTGLDRILKLLEKYAPLGKRFEPTAQMTELARTGRGFFV
ncbi:MAG: 3-hydroxyacyl-CoA dehydrogenase NAD-binding domain-containing protein [Gemmataceae bacterium]